MLLSEFHDDHWLPGIECLRECTRIGYESAWRRHIMPALGHTDMEDINVETVESWLARIPSRGAARKAWSGHVRIRRGVQWVNGHEVVVEPKTELSRRTVVLPRFAVLRLRQIKGKGRLTGGLNPGQVDRRYRTWCRRQGLPCVPRRNLRHSWATTALAAGVDVAVVSRALGHSSIETTARYYLRPDLNVLKEAQRAWEHSIMA